MFYHFTKQDVFQTNKTTNLRTIETTCHEASPEPGKEDGVREPLKRI